MDNPELFVDVVLPLPVGGTFTYIVPPEFHRSVSSGVRVVVQFGKRKIYTSIVIRTHFDPPTGYQAKPILSVLDEEPVVVPVQMQFWHWMASYYLCHLGDVMNAALPSAFKLASESKITAGPTLNENQDGLTEKEQLLLEALHYRKSIKVEEVVKIVGQQKVIPLIKTLIDKGHVKLEEEVSERYQPLKEWMICLSPEYEDDEEKLEGLFNQLDKRAKRQLEVLMVFYQKTRIEGGLKELKRSELMKASNATTAVIEAMVEKNIFMAYEKTISRLELVDATLHPDQITLSGTQEKALDSIKFNFVEKDVVLLHGVTSSGKTEIYIKLIQEAISKGKQVLYLLPEIALTGHVINRLRKYFGNRIGVSHSRFNENERVEIYKNILPRTKIHATTTSYDIILGARSALFLPFSNLGLVIVDEEHDPSFKQFDPAPRYNARDSAIYLAHLHGAKVLLGSATPSVESYFNATERKYGLVEIMERYGAAELPEIKVVDVKGESRSQKMKSHFSSVLLQHLEGALERKEQSILFQNRRGFSLRLECETCQWMPTCNNCDVTLVYHKQQNQLRCHYCGYTRRIPEKCPECNGVKVRMKGFGTEKVEEELSLIYPHAKIGRMDLDTTRTKHAYQKILDDFEQGKIDVLVGTQMVTKGLDFANVSTVSILNADNMLSFPDFRAGERSFQLMAQVSGRSGRKNYKGVVIIQTYNPKHPIIHFVVKHDYKAMYQHQLLDRHKFNYPPYCRLIQLRLKHKNMNLLNKASDVLASKLKKRFGKRVLGPEYPLVGKVMNYYIKHILIKIEKEASILQAKAELVRIVEEFYLDKEISSVWIIMDVDPQ